MYFTMDSLNQIHFLYQYSLQMFLDMFSSVLLSNPRLEKISDYESRLNVIRSDLFSVSIFVSNIFVAFRIFFVIHTLQ